MRGIFIMKRVLSLIISICIIAVTALALPAVSAEESTAAGISGLLAELNIMSGDPDGNLRLGDYVSRAEFTKIVVAASSYKNSVATNLSISPFPDVTYKHWAAPYVRVGVTNGIVSGYPDGTFKPEDTVLYEEAITMLLRVLGYTDADFGVSWPSGQIGLANNLDVTDSVDCSAGDIINRGQVAQLVYNTLKTKQKNTQNALISVFDAQIYEDVTLVAGSGEDSSIASDEVFTTKGTYKIDSGFDASGIGREGDAVVKDGNKLIAFIPDPTERSAEEYIVYSVLDNKVMAYRNGSVRQIEINDDTAAYKGTSRMTFAALKNQLELGDRIRVRKSDSGDVDYVTYVKGDLLGPITATGGNWKTAWSVSDDATITRNGVSVSAGDIQSYDIVYYLKELNMVLAYSNKVTGIYEKATPNRDVPTSVTISGKDYELEGSAAFNKLYSGGTFEYGDTITVLLGKNNKIADVITPSATADGVVGYLTSTGTKEYSSGDIDTYTNYYINIVQPDGMSYEYVTDRDYSENRNSVVELYFSGGYARLRSINGSSSVSGTFDWSSKKIGSSKIASSIDILDIGTTDNSKQGMYARVYGQRIDGVNIQSVSVLYAEKNSYNEITKLILNNVTNDAYTYGIVTGMNTAGLTSTYNYLSEGRRYTTTINGKYSINRSAIRISGSANKPDSLQEISVVDKKITSISSDKLIAENVTYKISDKVQVYKRESSTSAEYSMMSLSDIVSNRKNYTIYAYYDKPSNLGGRIRVIVAVDKN